jgi:hypothetical protein
MVVCTSSLERLDTQRLSSSSSSSSFFKMDQEKEEEEGKTLK